MSFLKKLAEQEQPKQEISELAEAYIDAVSGGFEGFGGGGEDDFGDFGSFTSALELDGEFGKKKKTSEYKLYLQVCSFRQYTQENFTQNNNILCPI
jgi:hypothetical protein